VRVGQAVSRSLARSLTQSLNHSSFFLPRPSQEILKAWTRRLDRLHFQQQHHQPWPHATGSPVPPPVALTPTSHEMSGGQLAHVATSNHLCLAEGGAGNGVGVPGDGAVVGVLSRRCDEILALRPSVLGGRSIDDRQLALWADFFAQLLPRSSCVCTRM